MPSSVRASLVTCVTLLVAVASRAERIEIDFSRQTATSSHLLFGGASPNHNHAHIWPKLSQAGFTSLRFDAWLGNGTDPAGITLEQYKAQMGVPGSVADVNSRHWNWARIEGNLAICEAHGMTPVVVLCYTPKWLSHSGERHSPPRDFAVWRDIVRQIVQRYRGRVRHWEIWNEPNGPEFMKLGGSPYPETKDGMLAAYLDICRHTLDAIDASGVEAEVGGPALATWGSDPFIGKFLAERTVARRLQFLTHHIYFHTPIPNRCYPPAIRAHEATNGLPPLPLYITEWNSNSGVDENTHPLKNSPASVGWVGKTFVLFLRWGVRGAHIYNVHEGRAIDDGYGGAYRIVGGQPVIYRFVKVFHLLSRVLGLGQPDDAIRVVESRVAGLPEESELAPHFLDSLYAVGCFAPRGTPVVVVANPSGIVREADLAVRGLPAGAYRLVAHIVRSDHTPDEALVPTPLFERIVTSDDAGLATRFDLPASSVVGLRLERLLSGAGPSRVVNLSVRCRAGAGQDVAIVGVTVSGSPAEILVRGIGPGLAPFGVAGALPDPRLALFDGDRSAGENNDWHAGGAGPLLSDVFRRCGAFPPAAGSRDAALVAFARSAFTAHVGGAAGTSGVVLLEAYDVARTEGELVNLSARARVGAGEDSLLAGFVIDGAAPRRLLLRAAGPALGVFGVSGAVADPALELLDAGGASLARNDAWDADDTTGAIARAAAEAGAFGFVPGSRDTALLRLLPPGQYGARVAAKDPGVALLEVYALP